MVDLNASFIERLSRNSNTSEPNYVKPTNQNGSTIIILGIFGIVLVVIILVSYCAWYKFCMSKKQKIRQQSVRSRAVSSLYPSPVRCDTIADSTRISAIYILPVSSDTTLSVIDELPPEYHSYTLLQARQSEAVSRL